MAERLVIPDYQRTRVVLTRFISTFVWRNLPTSTMTVTESLSVRIAFTATMVLGYAIAKCGLPDR